jgi:hypothetical protein
MEPLVLRDLKVYRVMMEQWVRKVYRVMMEPLVLRDRLV